MEAPRILIACSSDALFLAEKLQHELKGIPCESVIWSEEEGGRTSFLTIQMLEDAAGQFDFAVMILTKGDLIARESAGMQQARETSAFRVGLFIATIGRNRCFLLRSAEPADVPAHFDGIVSIPFEEPANVDNESEFDEAIVRVAAGIAEEVKLQGKSTYHIHVPTMAMEEIWHRERPRSEGGELRGGDVVVCDTQPIPDEELAALVRRNLDSGISYTYFLHFSPDSIEKVCQCLQLILASGSESVPNFQERINRIRNEKDRILDDFLNICRERKLRIAFFPDEPQFVFRVHNASSRDLATVYVRYGDKCFIEWVRGPVAAALWRSLPRYLEDDGKVRLFIPLIRGNFDDAVFNRTFDRALGLYFPGMEDSIKKICVGDY